MQTRTRQIAEVTIVDLSGRIVAGEDAALLRDSIRTLISLGEKNIVLNMEAVPYIDSAGIGELVSAMVAVRKQGGSLKLLNLTRRVYEVLEIVRLVTVFEIFDDEGKALSTFPVTQSYAAAMRARAS
jgi:anti-sigma B factor antagonist